MMSNRNKVILLLFQLVVVWWLSFALVHYAGCMEVYSNHVYPAVQTVRHSVVGWLPLSVGDVLYFVAGVWVLLTVVKWVYYTSKWKLCKEKLMNSVLRSLNVLVFVYVLFVLGWGAHYNRPPLAKAWGLEAPTYSNEADRKLYNVQAIEDYARLLVGKLNEYAPQYKTMSYKQINDSAVAYYRQYTNSAVKQYGLGIKPSMYGKLMQRMAIDGYFNPFTGEGQVMGELPAYMMPFTVCHEMAHQAGIAAEGDANLLAYAVGTTTANAVFRYSAYLNLWLYARRRLYYTDSVVAKEIASTLPLLSQKHIDTLEQLSKMYHGMLTSYTGTIYDSYLKTQHQQEGIRSYGNVLSEAMLLEEHRRVGAEAKQILLD